MPFASVRGVATGTPGTRTSLRTRAHGIGVVLLSSLCLMACAARTSPSGSRSGTAALTEAEERAIGASADQIVRKSPGLYAGAPDLAAYVRSIGVKIAASSKRLPDGYTFAIVDSADLNAFALPGGYIYVTRGLLGWLNSEDELAAVLAHEVAHVSERHGLARLAKIEATCPPSAGGESGSAANPDVPPVSCQEQRGRVALDFALDKESVAITEDVEIVRRQALEDEREADVLAEKALTAAGYQAGALDDLTATISRAQSVAPRRLQPWLATHPTASEDRGGVRSGSSPPPGSSPPGEKERSSSAGGSGGPAEPGESGKSGESGASGSSPDSRREAYVAKLEGLSGGQGNAASWVSGDLYVNTRHDFSLRVPPGWTPELHGPDLVLHGPGGRDRAQMNVETLSRPGVSADVARSDARSAAREGLGTAGPLTKATLPAGEAAILPLRSKDANGQPVLTRKMFLVRFDRAYVLSFTTPADKVEETDQTFMKLTGSIVFLSPDGLESLQDRLAPRIRLYRARDGDSWDSLASRHGVGAPAPGAAGGAGQPDEGEAAPEGGGAPGLRGADALAAFNGQDAREPLRAGLLLKLPLSGALE